MIILISGIKIISRATRKALTKKVGAQNKNTSIMAAKKKVAKKAAPKKAPAKKAKKK